MVVGADGIDDSVGPDFLRVIQTDSDAGIGLFIDKNGLLLEVTFSQTFEGMRERRDDVGDNDSIDHDRFPRYSKEFQQENAEFISRPFLDRFESPMLLERIAIK